VGKEVPIDSRVGNLSFSSWSCLIGFTTFALHPLIWLVMKKNSQIFYKWISISSLLKSILFKFYANGFPYIFFVQELFFSSSLQIGTHVFFSQDLYETKSCRSNSWTNQICSKLHKINPSLNSNKNSSIRTNPLLANPIDSNQLSLKLRLEINTALETSWKYLGNHVWWCCVRLYLCVLFILHMVDCLQGIMRMGVLVVWRWWVMLTCYCGPWIIHHPQRCMWYWPCRMVHSRTWCINYTPYTHKDVCDIDLVGWCIQGRGALTTRLTPTKMYVILTL
jgi:hypothetical protein